jgi:hypothetical protein
MTKKPTAQECEQLRKEVKESKKEFLCSLFNAGMIILTILVVEYGTKDVWTLKDVFLYSFIVYLVNIKFPFKSNKNLVK